MTHGKRLVWPGRPSPLGATFDGHGVNFALFSSHATRVELCLFDSTGRRELERITLPEYTNQVWHGYLPEAEPGLLYGYRVHGPYQPDTGHRFNHHKLLIDPYAKSLRGTVRWSDALFGYRVGSRREDMSFDRRDSALGVPKAVVVDPSFAWNDDRPPQRAWSDTIVYEAHVKGFTQLHPSLPPQLRGTYAALGSAPVIEHLVDLGVTAIELLPIHAFVDDRVLVERGLRNYWGYNTIGFFAPEPRYMSPSGALGEIKTMVRRLHAVGIEVILDVVYNHTAEGNRLGPTLSFRGIDNASYYRLAPDNQRDYVDVTGTGNTLNLANTHVLRLVMDSLRYWVEEVHVDGFRFDLATSLARDSEHRFDPGSAFFDAIRQDPVLSRVKLIAEPWDLGMEGYRLGGHGPGWAEWNDRFRDTVRGFWRGNEGILPELAARLLGSSDLFEHEGRRPWSSVNFVTCHDGFTMADLVSYNSKHNEANGEDNRDGNDNNLSWNCGVEGPTDQAAVLEQRARFCRGLLATILVAQGTPMILMGDEFGRSQRGNNNSYCQDSEISWFDWSSHGAAGSALMKFVRRLVDLRKTHPIFRRQRHLHGREASPDGFKDVTWITADGREMAEGDWHNPALRCIGMALSGAAGDYRDHRGRPLGDNTFLIVFNAGHEAQAFTLPRFDGTAWHRELDTAAPDFLGDEPHRAGGASFQAEAHCVVLFRMVTAGVASVETPP